MAAGPFLTKPHKIKDTFLGFVSAANGEGAARPDPSGEEINGSNDSEFHTWTDAMFRLEARVTSQFAARRSSALCLPDHHHGIAA
jgi:hypothetical protein